MLMEPKLAAEVCDELESAGHAALALQDTHTSGIDYLVSENFPLNQNTSGWMKATATVWRAAKNLGEPKSHQHTVRIGIVATPPQVASVKERLEKRFGDRIFFHSVVVPRSNVEVLEIFDPSVNKWEGILHVARRHGIEPRQIIAIGDDMNDLHMIRNAGLGVAMGNARPEVQAIAQRVIGSNHEDGLAEFLEEIVAAHAVEPLSE
jgi:HAD superfamily hydrolase (TIGR01484 family)